MHKSPRLKILRAFLDAAGTAEPWGYSPADGKWSVPLWHGGLHCCQKDCVHSHETTAVIFAFRQLTVCHVVLIASQWCCMCLQMFLCNSHSLFVAGWSVSVSPSWPQWCHRVLSLPGMYSASSISVKPCLDLLREKIRWWVVPELALCQLVSYNKC